LNNHIAVIPAKTGIHLESGLNNNIAVIPAKAGIHLERGSNNNIAVIPAKAGLSTAELVIHFARMSRMSPDGSSRI